MSILRKLEMSWVDWVLGAFAFIALVSLSMYYLTPSAEPLKDCLVTKMYSVRLCDNEPGFVRLDQISPYIIGAVIMSEDASFFTHEGVDVNEIRESFIKNLALGKFARGGSTITQQLAKNVFLTGEKSIVRKLQEVYLAFQIEKLFTKKRILTLYLNVVEFGQNLYGVGRACQYYFHKSCRDVAPEEAAYLAFLLPNPKKYSQSFYKHQMTPFADQMVKRILHKMYMGRKISEGEYQIARGRVASMFGGSENMIPALPEGEILEDEPKDFRFESEIESVEEI